MGSTTSRQITSIASPKKANPVGAGMATMDIEADAEIRSPTWIDMASPSRTSTFRMSDFVILEDKMLGEGSFAKVMLARHKRSGKLAAEKIIDKTKIPATMKPYVVREPRVLPALHHKNVVKLLLTDEDDEHIYMFMQYMAGGDLHNYVEAKEWLDEREARRVFSQILDAVEYCHQNWICHRDLKLENVLVSKDGKRVMLIDFGFAGVMEGGPQHLFTDHPGSVVYAPPELISGLPYSGASADVYSLGVLLYTMVHGKYPFFSEQKPELYRLIMKSSAVFDDSLSDDCINLIRLMLTKSPDSRITIQQIRNHPWMKAEKPMMSPLRPVMKQCTAIKDSVEVQLSPKRVQRKLLY